MAQAPPIGSVDGNDKTVERYADRPARGVAITDGPWTVERLIEEATKGC
jgi:hypothetical protein